MLAQESWVNNTENYRCGDSGYYEPFTDNLKILFRNYQREYGRCISKIYIDTPEGAKAIGWVFRKRAKYTDCNEHYILETWITLHEAQPEKSVKYNYKYL